MISGRKSPLRFEIVALIAILLLAGALRLVAPGVVEFKRDEANLSLLALEFARGGSLPLLGISSSVGIPNPPVSVYLFAIPYRFSSDPTLATQFVGLLNVLAVFLTYLLARRYYGLWVALLAALLYAISPWGIIYARKIWAQDLLPPFVVATMLAGLAGFLEGKRWGQWLFLPLLSLTVQIHYSAAALVVPAVYVLWLGRLRWRRSLLWGLLIAILLVAPFLLGVLRADLPSMEELQSSVAAGAQSTHSIAFTDAALRYAALLIAGTDIHALAGPQQFQAYLATVPPVYPLFGLLAWGWLLSAGWLVVRLWRIRDARSSVDTLLLLWFFVPVIAFSVTWTTIYPHYLITIMPAAYLVMGVGMVDLWRALRAGFFLRRAVFAAGGLGLVIILALQVVLWLRLVDFLKITYTSDGFGAPLAHLMPVRQAALDMDIPQLVAHLDGQAVGVDDEATVWNFLLYDISLRRFVDEAVELYPADAFLKLTSTCDDAAASAQFPLRSPQEGCYQLAQSAGGIAPSAYEPIENEPVFANGVQVKGYRWSVDGQVCLELIWGITAPTDQDYSFSVHFTGKSGEEILNADALSWRGMYWRPGDTVLRRFCLSPDQVARASEITGVNLGMYTYDGQNFHNVDVLDQSGTPIGQTVHIDFNL